jgi:Ca2+-binding RTX toxin-like protein
MKPTDHFLLQSAFVVYEGKAPSPEYEATGSPITNELGLYAAIYRKKGTHEYIFLFRGTEPPNTWEGAKDWSNNFNDGWPQYAQARARIAASLQEIVDSNSNAKVHLVGHSLGGALAQFTAYDFASLHTGAQNNRITLTTWNSLGGGWGLSKNVNSFNPSLLEGIDGTHFFRFDDIVARLGGSHIGGRKIMLVDPEGKMEWFLPAHMMEETEEGLLYGKRIESAPNYVLASSSTRALLGPLSAFLINFFDPRIEGLGTGELIKSIPAVVANIIYMPALAEILILLSQRLGERAVNSASQMVEDLKSILLEKADKARDNPEHEKELAEALLEPSFRLLMSTDPTASSWTQEERESAATLLKDIGVRLDSGEDSYGDLLQEFSILLTKPDAELPLSMGQYILTRDKEFRIDRKGIRRMIGLIRQKFRETTDKMSNVEMLTPLALDLDGGGIATLGLEHRIYFDHNNNGFAERTGWIDPGDGLLVYDRNGNGFIDSGVELFGDHTPISRGRNATNGFEALADLDDNQDGMIDLADACWSQLGIWKDGNSDGIMQKEEWISMQAANIQALSLSYTRTEMPDLYGNIHRERGTYILSDGTDAEMTDVWFTSDRGDSQDLGIVELSPEIAILPDLEAGGDLPSLRQAMQRDSSGELARIVRLWLETPEENRAELLTPLMHAWSGVSNLPDPMMEGFYDLRSLRVLEALNGSLFMDGLRLPDLLLTPILDNAFTSLSRSVSGLLNTADYFQEFLGLITMRWDAREQEVVWGLEPAIQYLKTAVVNGAGSTFLRDLRYAIESLGDTGTKLISAFRSRLHSLDLASELPLRWLVEDNLLLGSPDNDVLVPDHTSPAAISAGAGDDEVYAQESDDLIDGGEGNDSLHGRGGSDIYLFRSAFGKDIIHEAWNNNQPHDTVVFSDYKSTDVSGIQSRNGNLVVSFQQGDELTISRYVSDAYRNHRINRLRFADGVDWSRENFRNSVAPNQATTGDDILSANDPSTGSQSTILDGLAGNDLLLGSSLNDQLQGNLGHDALHGGAGEDWLSGGQGNDWLEGGPGRDRYFYRQGDGLDTIPAKRDEVLEERDTIQFDADIRPTDVVVSHDSGNSDLVLTIKSSRHQIRIKDFLVDHTPFQPLNPIEAAQFADGTRWDVWQLTQQAMQGSEGNDSIKGTIHNDSINGGGGGNRLEGLAGDDVLHGGNGYDEILGGEGNDTLHGGLGINHYITQQGHGHDIIVADVIADSSQRTGTLMINDNTRPEDLRFSRSGNDLEIDIAGSGSEITVQAFFHNNSPDNPWNPLATIKFASTWDYLSREDIMARVRNNIRGTDGVDYLRGLLASSYLTGLDGDDILQAGEGDDLLDGSAGIDTVSYADARQGVQVDLSLSTAQDTGGAGSDTLVAIENLHGSGFADSLSGSGSSNHLDGGGGDDILWGSLGADQHRGGAGADRFIYRSIAEIGHRVWGRDWILDFSNEDRLDLSRIDADPGRPGHQTFAWIGDATFTAPGQLRYSLVDGHGLLKGNLEGPSNPEFTVVLQGGFRLDPAVHLLL